MKEGKEYIYRHARMRYKIIRDLSSIKRIKEEGNNILVKRNKKSSKKYGGLILIYCLVTTETGI